NCVSTCESAVCCRPRGSRRRRPEGNANAAGATPQRSLWFQGPPEHNHMTEQQRMAGNNGSIENGSFNRVGVPPLAVCLCLFKQHFLNRTDVLAFDPPWRKEPDGASPAEVAENLDAMLAAHVLGEGAGEVSVRGLKGGKPGRPVVGRFRHGTYSPA